MGSGAGSAGRPLRALLGLGLGGLLLLGVSDGMLGVAWPSMRVTFGAPLAGLGLIFAVITIGFLAASVGTAVLAPGLAIGRRLLFAGGAMCLAMVGFVLSPAWPALVAAAFVYGVAAGLLDPGVNAHVALRHSNRELNLLHAGYGAGASLGPLLMSLTLVSGFLWRVAYLPVLLLYGALLAGFVHSRKGWSALPPITAAANPARAGSGMGRQLALGVVSFFVYTGIEVSAGGWSYSYLTLGRGMSPALAGLLAGSFWAALTLGRMAGAAIAARVQAPLLLLVGAAIAFVGALLLAPSPGVGLPLLGVGLAPIFPTLVSLTPGWRGETGTQTAVGYQLAAGSLGAAVVPALAGLILERFGVGLLPSLLAGAAACQVILVLATRRRASMSKLEHPRSS